MPGRIKTVSHEFEFDKSRTLIVSEKPCGVGNNCIAYKCTVLFNEEDSESDEKKNCKKDGESDKKKDGIPGILREFAPSDYNVSKLSGYENEMYRYLPSDSTFKKRFDDYVDRIKKIRDELNKIIGEDPNISWYYENSGIFNPSQNSIVEFNETEHKYRALFLSSYIGDDSGKSMENLDMPSRLESIIILCSVVEKFHKHNLLLADLKPSNYIYASDGTTSQLKIIDIDATVQLDKNGNIEENQIATGTPFYSFQKLFRDDSSEEYMDLYKYGVAKKADIYSLGAILLNAVTIKFFDELANDNKWFSIRHFNAADGLNSEVFAKLQKAEEDITIGFWNKFLQIIKNTVIYDDLKIEYNTAEELKQDIIALKEIYENKGVHPEVMLNNAIKDVQNKEKFSADNFDPDLFTEVEVVE